MRNMLSPRRWIMTALITTVVGGGGIAVATGALEGFWNRLVGIYHSSTGAAMSIIAYLQDNWATTLLPALGALGIFALVILFITDM